MEQISPEHREVFAAWTPQETATLMFVFDGNRVLLMRKKRGLGKGLMVGPGGRVETGETPIQAAIRETQEELLIAVEEPKQIGELQFQFTDGFAMRVWVYRADHFSGVPTETEEGDPAWFDVNRIPYHEMWEDDPIWFPHLCRSQPFVGRFLFDDRKMLTSELILT